MREESVLLLGSYGQTNLGDDLLMWNYLDFLQKRGFKRIYVNASVARYVPVAIKNQFTNIKVISTYKTPPFTWVKILRRVGYIVYGGGTVFKELYSSTGRGRYSVITRIMLFNLLARLLGAQIYYLNIGIGVLETSLGRAITRVALSCARLAIFRDDQSFLFAHDRLKLPVAKLCLTTDGLFLNDHWQKRWKNSDLRLPKGKRVVGVNLLSDIPDWVDRRLYIKAAKGFVKGLLDEGNFVLLMPFQHKFNASNDYKFMRSELASLIKHPNIKLLKSISIDQVFAVFESLDFFVGMRFHSLLMAVSSNTPFMAIAYDTKCWRFIEENDYQYALRLEDVSQNHLKSVFERLVENRAKVPRILRHIAAKQLKKGSECLDQLSL